jgi:galactose-1-phosphate uridylyltransferase
VEPKFLDPRKGFEENKLHVEIRADPLTHRHGRVCNFRFKIIAKPDLSGLVERSRKQECPFCPELIEKATPKFLKEFIPEGRIRVSEAIVFPNSMPYDRHNAIVTFSGEHFTEMKGFTEELLVNAFLACQVYLKRVLAHDSACKYLSINWNYMPLSGGGLIHPHLQIIASDFPTNYHEELVKGSERYYEENSRNFWADLIAREEEIGKRYVGSIGDVSWLTSFVPKGMMMDIAAIFRERNSILDLSKDDLKNFSNGLQRVLTYLDDQNFCSFNLAIYSGLIDQGYFWTNARVVSRFTIPPLDTSDINYFEKLHDETFIVKSPEDVCGELKEYFV